MNGGDGLAPKHLAACQWMKPENIGHVGWRCWMDLLSAAYHFSITTGMLRVQSTWSTRGWIVTQLSPVAMPSVAPLTKFSAGRSPRPVLLTSGRPTIWSLRIPSCWSNKKSSKSVGCELATEADILADVGRCHQLWPANVLWRGQEQAGWFQHSKCQTTRSSGAIWSPGCIKSK